MYCGLNCCWIACVPLQDISSNIITMHLTAWLRLLSRADLLWFVIVILIVFSCTFLIFLAHDLGKATATLNRWTSKQAAANYQPFSFLSGSSWVARTWMGSMEMCRGHGILSKYVQGGWKVTEHFPKQLMTFLSWNANLRVTSSGQPSPPLLRLLPPSEEDRKANQRNNCVKAFQNTNCFTLFASLCIQFRFKSCTGPFFWCSVSGLPNSIASKSCRTPHATVHHSAKRYPQRYQWKSWGHDCIFLSKVTK